MTQDINDALRAGTFDPSHVESLRIPRESNREDFQLHDSGEAFDLDGAAPTLADQYGVAQLEADASRELVSIASLPCLWDGSNATGHGVGEHLNTLLGGGICAGYVLAVGASSAGAGKTAWTMQLADGLAMRSAEIVQYGKPGPLTPVLVLSEMSAQALSWRALARITGEDARTFRAGKSAPNTDAVRLAREAARNELDPKSPFGAGRRFMRTMRPGPADLDPPRFMGLIARVFDAWTDQLRADHGREVLPVLVLDPIQRWQNPRANSEIEALNGLVESLGAHAIDGGWCVIVTSDTNKAAAGKPDEASTADVFRGSYKLIHIPDAALILRKPEADKIGDEPTLEAAVIKNRWGSALPNPNACARYAWSVRCARFRPLPAPGVVSIDYGPAPTSGERRNPYASR